MVPPQRFEMRVLVLRMISSDPAIEIVSTAAGKAWALFKSIPYRRYATTGRNMIKPTIIKDLLTHFPPYLI